MTLALPHLLAIGTAHVIAACRRREVGGMSSWIMVLPGEANARRWLELPMAAAHPFLASQAAEISARRTGGGWGASSPHRVARTFQPLQPWEYGKLVTTAAVLARVRRGRRLPLDALDYVTVVTLGAPIGGV